MEALTYEELFDTLRREKSRDELQLLEPQFYDRTRVFMSEKETTIKAGSMSVVVQRAQIEYENTRRILRELYDRRERKIVTLAMHKTRTDGAVIDTEALLPEERTFFDNVVTLLTSSRTEVLGESPLPEQPAMPPIPEPTPEPVEEETTEPESTSDTASQEESLEVKFLTSVPKFVGNDLTVFGPYEEGAKAKLPESIGKILLKKKRVEITSMS